MTCTTGADATKLKCTTLEAGYSSDGFGMVAGEWSGVEWSGVEWSGVERSVVCDST